MSLGRIYNVNDTIFGGKFSLRSIKSFSKQAAIDIENYLKKRPHEVYGSWAQHAQGSRNSRPPADLDVAVQSVPKSRDAMTSILRKNGYNVRQKNYPEYGAAQIEVFKKGYGWDVLIDLQPLKKHQSEKRDFTGASPVKPIKDKQSGLVVQAPSDQLRRKHSAISNPNMPEHRKQKDSYDFVALYGDLQVSEDLKRDAKLLRGPPSFKEVMETPWKGISTPALAKRLEKDKNLERGSLKEAARSPLTPAQKRKWVKFATAHPEYDLDDIDFDKNGNLYVKDGWRR